MIDEGYIKFNCEWNTKKLPEIGNVEDLLTNRDLLFQKKLIGFDVKHNVGYGNISKRIKKNEFLVSGTQTGHIEKLNLTGYAYVNDFDITKNKVVCTGTTNASSESMTHAAVYLLHTEINAVVHVHHKKLWESLLDKMPTTGADVSYGTPAMANEVSRLYKETNLSDVRIFAMKGHEDGVISFGNSVKEANEVMMRYFTAL